MFINNENWEDCKKYYLKCWIKIVEQGDRIYTVDNVGADYTYLSSPSRGENDEDADCRIDMKRGYNIAYVIPKKTIFQYGENALMLERIPARMWKKGMDAKNTQFLILNEASSWSKTTISTQVIEGFINKPTYFTLEEANANFNGSLLSAALSPRVALSSTGAVFIDQVYVGRYIKEKRTLKYKGIYTELEALFPETTFIKV